MTSITKLPLWRVRPEDHQDGMITWRWKWPGCTGFFILDLSMVMPFLTCIVLVIFLLTVRQVLNQNNELAKEARRMETYCGWYFLVASSLTALYDGECLHCLEVFLLLACYFSTFLVAVAAGYVTVRMWRTLKLGIRGAGNQSLGVLHTFSLLLHSGLLQCLTSFCGEVTALPSCLPLGPLDSHPSGLWITCFLLLN